MVSLFSHLQLSSGIFNVYNKNIPTCLVFYLLTRLNKYNVQQCVLTEVLTPGQTSRGREDRATELEF